MISIYLLEKVVAKCKKEGITIVDIDTHRDNDPREDSSVTYTFDGIENNIHVHIVVKSTDLGDKRREGVLESLVTRPEEL